MNALARIGLSPDQVRKFTAGIRIAQEQRTAKERMRDGGRKGAAVAAERRTAKAQIRKRRKLVLRRRLLEAVTRFADELGRWE